MWLYVILVLPDRNTELGHLSQAWGLLHFAFLDMFFHLEEHSWCHHAHIFFLLLIQSVAFHKSVQVITNPCCCIGFYILPVLQKYFHISSTISAAMCDHSLSLFKNDNFCMHKNSVSVVHYPVLHLCFYVRPSALFLWNEHLFTSNFLNSSSSFPQEVPVETCKLLWDSWYFVWRC